MATLPMTDIPMTDMEAALVGSGRPSEAGATRLGQRLRSGIQRFSSGIGSPQPTTVHPTPDTAGGTYDAAYDASIDGVFYRKEVYKYPAGWPRIAAEQEAYPNAANNRKFGYLLKRCILDGESKLASLERRLFKLDHRLPIDDDMPTSDAQTSSSVASQSRPPQDVSGTLREICDLLPSYHQLLLNQKAFQSLHEVHRDEYNNMYAKIREENYLDEKDMAYLNHPDDFINAESDPMWRPFEALLYKLPNSILSVFEDKEASNRAHAFLLPLSTLRVLYKTIVIWFYALILLLPVIVLYVHPTMSQQAVICILAFFTILFTASMALHRGMKPENILLGVCAYAAVLVAFLANFQKDAEK